MKALFFITWLNSNFRDQKRKLAYQYSFEYDEDDSRSPNFESFLQKNRGAHPKRR